MATLVRDIKLENFNLEQGNINNFDIEHACEYFASIGSNALQKRTQNMFLKEVSHYTPSVQNIVPVQQQSLF